MSVRVPVLLWMVTAVCLISSSSLAAAASHPEDIAAGATVTFAEPPRYDLTADPDDARQLVDGATVDGTMWLSRKAVGWVAGPKPVRIDLDLGRVAAIADVCLHTARRSEAGVDFPVRVDVLAARQQHRFAWAGRMTPLADAGSGDYLAREFCVKSIGLPARYVSLHVGVVAGYFFADEITISEADAASASGSTRLVAEGDWREFIVQHEYVERSLAEIGESLPADPDIREHYQQLLEHVNGPPGTLDLAALRDRDRELHDFVRSLRQRRGGTFTATFCDPWSLATPFDGRALSSDPGAVEIASSQHGAVAIALEHALPHEVEVSTSATVTGKGAKLVTATLYEVGFVLRADGVKLGDALLPLTGGRARVASGETRQLWVDIAAADTKSDLDLTLAITLRTDDGSERVLTRKLLIYALPAIETQPMTVVWGYLDQGPIRDRPREAASDMLAHGVTSAVVPAGELPWPGDGYTTFDSVMRNLAGHDEFLFFLSLNEGSSYRARLGADFMSDDWQRRFSAWLRQWTARLRGDGLDPSRFAFYPVDEPQTSADIDTLVATSRLIKSIDPALRVYATIHDPAMLTNDVIGAVDIFQLNGQALEASLVERLKSRGKTVAGYATSGGGKSGEPGSFFRAQGWQAFSLGLDGFGFWAYADTGPTGSAWNDIDGQRPDFAVVYEGDRGIVSSKRWEAWREGVQDYRLLRLARNAAADEPTRALVLDLAGQAENHDYDTQTLSMLRTRLRLIAATGHDRLP